MAVKPTKPCKQTSHYFRSFFSLTSQMCLCKTNGSEGRGVLEEWTAVSLEAVSYLLFLPQVVVAVGVVMYTTS